MKPAVVILFSVSCDAPFIVRGSIELIKVIACEENIYTGMLADWVFF